MSTDVPRRTPKSSRWTGGWYRNALRVDSPNFGPRPAEAVIDLVVVHSISLPPGEYGTGDIERLFTNTLDWDAHPYFNTIRGIQVSSHFVIARSGTITQFVDCDQRAWHAGGSHYRGRDNCNDDSIGIELEGLEGESFTEAQYTALTSLCRDLDQRYCIRFIAGHEHVAPDRKRDPGPGFEWQKLRNKLCDLGWWFPLPASNR